MLIVEFMDPEAVPALRVGFDVLFESNRMEVPASPIQPAAEGARVDRPPPPPGAPATARPRCHDRLGVAPDDIAFAGLPGPRGRSPARTGGQ